MKIKLIVISIVFCLISGCTTLSDVKKELGKGGFALWYPAEGGISPGQIWKIDGKKKDIAQLKPEILQTIGPNPAKFETIKKSVNADISLNVHFNEEILSDVGPLSAKFTEATVKSIALEFGDTKIERLPIGQLRDKFIISKLPESYKQDLEKVRHDPTKYMLIAAVVNTSGMNYIFKCEDTSKLQAITPTISEIINANFNLEIVSKTQAIWKIPSSQNLTIGISPVAGNMLNLTDKRIEVVHKSIRLDKNPREYALAAVHESKIMRVTVNEKEVVIKNKLKSPIAIIISWDGKDPSGVGVVGDSYFHKEVLPQENIRQEFNNHYSVQVWAWIKTRQLLDSCSLQIISNP